jgi:diguanylate cyclase (GGDEF)-like protein
MIPLARRIEEGIFLLQKTVFVYFLTLLPGFGLLLLLHEGSTELGRDLLTLWLITQVVLCVPFCRIFIRLAVVPDLREIRAFVASLREGGAPLFTRLPNQTEEEDDLLLLKRALNALSRVVIGYRERAGECLTVARRDMSRYRELAHVDQLTGVYNRRAFDQELTVRIARADRDNRVFWLVFLDLDDFKQVNDTHGHPAGDELLTFMGTILRECTRDDDFPFRYGGDEFGLIFGGESREDVQAVIRRIRTGFAHNPHGVDVSMGGVRYSRALADGGSRALCRRVDKALYLAKQSKDSRQGSDAGSVLFDS